MTFKDEGHIIEDNNKILTLVFILYVYLVHIEKLMDFLVQTYNKRISF